MTKYTDNLIPIMTSNTTPSGVAFANSVYDTGYDVWKAFNGIDDAVGWLTKSRITTGYIGYDFKEDVKIGKYLLKSSTSYLDSSPKNWTFEGSNDGVDYTILDTQVNQTWTANTSKEYIFNNNKTFKMYRLNITMNNGGTYLCLNEFKMYGIDTTDKILLLSGEKIYGIEKPLRVNLIPIMTSNTAPRGAASASTSYTGLEAWRAFDGNKTDVTKAWSTNNVPNGWLQYKFAVPTCINKIAITTHVSDSNRSPKNWTFMGSNTGSFTGEQTILDTRVNVTDWKAGGMKEFSFSNKDSFLYYRISITANNGNTYLGIQELEMFETMPQKINQIPSHSQQNIIKYGMDLPVQVDGIFSIKNYILQDTVSEDTDGLWKQELNRKPLSIKFD